SNKPVQSPGPITRARIYASTGQPGESLMLRFVGIDISKQQLDVHIRPDDQRFQFSNDAVGIDGAVSHLRRVSPELIVLEPTGGYEHQRAGRLIDANLPVVVVNARWVRNFARASGHLAKTDAIDAGVLSEFADKMRPPLRAVPDEQLLELRGLLLRRRQIID